MKRPGQTGGTVTPERLNSESPGKSDNGRKCPAVPRTCPASTGTLVNAGQTPASTELCPNGTLLLSQQVLKPCSEVVSHCPPYGVALWWDRDHGHPGREPWDDLAAIDSQTVCSCGHEREVHAETRDGNRGFCVKCICLHWRRPKGDS
jgi:hypothetical protein